MMKRAILIFFSAVAVIMSGCNKAEIKPAVDDMVTMTYTVNNPMATKALGAGDAVNYVWYALYRTDGTLVKDFGIRFFNNGSAYCPVTMVRDQSYKVVFVAQHYKADGETKTPAYTIDPATATLTMPVAAVANSDDYDLFCLVDEVLDFQGGNAKSVTLSRNVAQVNYFCNDIDWENAATLGMTPTASSVTLEGVPAKYDLLKGKPSIETVTVTYAKSALSGDTNLLGTAFCLAGDNLTKATLSLYKDEEVTTTLDVDNVSVKPNYRTNITGSIMTGTVNYTVSLDVDSTEQTHPLH